MFIFHQASLNKAIEQILNATVGVELWKYADLHFTQQQMEAEAARKMGEDIKTQIKPPKPMHKQIRYLQKLFHYKVVYILKNLTNELFDITVKNLKVWMNSWISIIQKI